MPLSLGEVALAQNALHVKLDLLLKSRKTEFKSLCTGNDDTLAILFLSSLPSLAQDQVVYQDPNPLHSAVTLLIGLRLRRARRVWFLTTDLSKTPFVPCRRGSPSRRRSAKNKYPLRFLEGREGSVPGPNLHE